MLLITSTETLNDLIRGIDAVANDSPAHTAVIYAGGADRVRATAAKATAAADDYHYFSHPDPS